MIRSKYASISFSANQINWSNFVILLFVSCGFASNTGSNNVNFVLF